MNSWTELRESMSKELKGPSGAHAKARRGADDFTKWAEEQKVPLVGFDVDTVLKEFTTSLEVYQKSNGQLNAAGVAAVNAAKTMMAKMAGEKTTTDAVDAVVATFDKAPAETQLEDDTHSTDPLTSPPEPDMMKKPTTPEPPDDLEEEYDEEDDEFEEDEPEAQPPPRVRVRPPPRPQVIQVLQAPQPQRRGAPMRAEPRTSPRITALLPRPEKIRLFKRDDFGKKVWVQDYTLEEIGDVKLESFLREYVDPNFYNESGVTEYVVFEVDPRTDKEKGPPSSITIERDTEEKAPSNDPFVTARKAVSFVQELREAGRGEQPQKNEVFDLAKKEAAAKGDFGQLMMLFMMDKMMSSANGGGQNNDLIVKVMDRLERVERGGRGEPIAPPGFGPPGFPPHPYYMPPPPQPPPQHSSLDKVMELAIAKLANPPGLTDQLKELQLFQQLTTGGGNNANAGLQAQLSAIQQQLATKPAGSLDDSVATFEKMSTLVKVIAPQLDSAGGGLSGFLKGILTPEMGKVIGDVVAQVAKPAGAAPATVVNGQPVTAGSPQAQAAASKVATRDPSQPPMPAPPAVVEAVKAFGIAQTREVQAERFADLVIAMYMTEDPFYKALLQPALDDLNRCEESVERLRTPRRVCLTMLTELDSRFGTPDFADLCIAALMKKAMATPPPTFTSTFGKWILDYRGNVLLLEQVGAKPVVEVPPVPVPVVKFEPTPTVELLDGSVVPVMPVEEQRAMVERSEKVKEQREPEHAPGTPITKNGTGTHSPVLTEPLPIQPHKPFVPEKKEAEAVPLTQEADSGFDDTNQLIQPRVVEEVVVGR